MTQTTKKQVLGYTLLEQLGSGGYGEVWSAEAPGGLLKAVKLVYGYHDEHRAQTELRSLERIKQIRHPFLLSLERIDVVDGQLVIVSELAEGSLADVYNKCIEEGQVGIPRERLLSFIRDAAEALDFLSTKHSLQHLDVKPDNLLVIGDHVKLADFGLVKDINTTQQSLVTGMTPIYAAPEIFDGRPGSKSDQYSLAVVYQELLTSTRPFNGESSAQLAIQHLKEKPDLRQLPKSDQPLLAKALSKDPKNRFANCKQFVDELLNRKIRKKTVHGIQNQNGVGPRPNSARFSNNIDQTEIVTGTLSPFQQQPVQKLPAPDLSDSAEWLQPTVVVAIGGMATKTLQQLKSKVVGTYGEIEELPSFKLLCIDTDATTFDSSHSSHLEANLVDSESLCLRLRSPDYYRNKSATSLQWLSRRWIYNIPKSLQTEGVRPLGRLAFADHFEEVCDAIRSAIEQVTRPENLAKTSDTLEAVPAKRMQPRVMVVCSMNGGASGMLFDVGYLIRTLLIEEGFESDSVTAVLSHSIGSRASKAELSMANSLATFAELRHFVDRGYPGDDTLGIPPFEDQPFGHVYFHDLGEDSRQSDLQEQIAEVSEWIYLNTLSNSARFFDACRSQNDQEQFELRTFGLKSLGPSEHYGTLGIANQLASDLVYCWTSQTEDGPNGVSSLPNVTGIDIDFETISKPIHEFIGEDDATAVIQSCHEQAGEIVSQSASVKHELTELFDQIYGLPSYVRPIDYRMSQLESTVEQQILEWTEKECSNLKQGLVQMLNGKRLRIEPIRRAVSDYMARAEELSESLKEKMNVEDQQADQLLDAIAINRHEKKKDFDLDAVLESYQSIRHNHFVYRYVVLVLRSLIENSFEFLGSLANAVKILNSIREEFSEGIDEEPPQAQPFSLVRQTLEAVSKSHAQRLIRFENEFCDEFTGNYSEFSALLGDRHLLQRTIPMLLRSISIRISAEALRHVSIDKIIAETKLPPEKLVAWMNDQLNDALPEAKNSGGNVRLLLSVPERGNDKLINQALAHYFKLDSSFIAATCGDLIFCFEGDGISLASVAASMVEEKPRALDLSSRLHCRQDIEWSRIHDLF